MERLTERSKKRLYKNALPYIYLTKGRGADCIAEALTKLAAYEDAGLTPDEVAELAKMAVDKQNEALKRLHAAFSCRDCINAHPCRANAWVVTFDRGDGKVCDNYVSTKATLDAHKAKGGKRDG